MTTDELRREAAYRLSMSILASMEGLLTSKEQRLIAQKLREKYTPPIGGIEG